MANTFSPSEVPQQLVDEVETRADGLQLMKWSAQRFPWIHVLSCSSACNSNYNSLGTNNVGQRALSFKSGISGVATLSGYNSATNLPFPVVEGLDIKAMGSLGTTRKAVLKIICYTDEELVELQKCYFIPGMDIRVQWGWNKSCNQKTPPPLITDPEIETSQAVRQINALRKKYTNYDGFQGIVSNFGYNLNTDNAWECEVEFISAADPFTDSTITDSQHPCSREVETDKGDTVESWGPIYAAFKDIFTSPLESYRVKREVKKSAPKKPDSNYYVSYKQYEGNERTEGGGDNSSWYSGIFGGVETNESYINLGLVLDIINITQIPNEGGKFPYGHITCNNVQLPRPKLTLSADPRVCYLPNSDSNASITPFNHIMGQTDSEIECVTKDYVKLDNIMVNIIFLLVEYRRAAEGDGKLSTFVNGVLNGINRVCGNPWTFALVSDESDKKSTGPTINIIDSKQAIEQQTPFAIPSTVSDSTLRDFSLDLKMTGAMKTQALYANNQQKGKGYGDGGDATGCTGVSTKAFYIGADIKNKAKPKKELPTSSLGCENSSQKATPPTILELIDELYSDVNDSTTGALLGALVKKLNEGDDKDKSHCYGVPLPFDFAFTMDGIGGFEFGQLVTSNRIPKAIRDEFRWQITKVEHSITANDWSTTVSTICRSQPKL